MTQTQTAETAHDIDQMLNFSGTGTGTATIQRMLLELKGSLAKHK